MLWKGLQRLLEFFWSETQLRGAESLHLWSQNNKFSNNQNEVLQPTWYLNTLECSSIFKLSWLKVILFKYSSTSNHIPNLNIAGWKTRENVASYWAFPIVPTLWNGRCCTKTWFFHWNVSHGRISKVWKVLLKRSDNLCLF